MIESEDALRELLRTTPLARSRVAGLLIPETHEAVFAVEVGDDAFGAWQMLRELLPQTGRWPVLACLYPGDRQWPERVCESGFFDRFQFQHEPGSKRAGNDPDAIIAAARQIDVQSAIASTPIGYSEGPEEDLEFLLEETEQQFGRRPGIAEPLAFLAEHGLHSQDAIERWLYEWEMANFPGALALPEHGLAHLRGYQFPADEQALLLMPSTSGWEVPAYFQFYGATQRSSELVVALLRHWHETYGAELMANYGTMMHFTVARRPQLPQEAFRLACQQAAIAGDTIFKPGVSIRNHARALMHTDHWFLHNRP